MPSTSKVVRNAGDIWFDFHILQLLMIEFNATKLVLRQQIYNKTYAK